MKDPNRRFYGALTVSERGQIVIPAQARHGLAIDKAENIIARNARVEQLLGGSADHD